MNLSQAMLKLGKGLSIKWRYCQSMNKVELEILDEDKMDRIIRSNHYVSMEIYQHEYLLVSFLHESIERHKKSNLYIDDPT